MDTTAASPDSTSFNSRIFGLVGFSLLALWLYFVLTNGMAWLWGPYAIIFYKASWFPLSRLGSMLFLVALPLMAVVVPLAKSRSISEWLVRQASWLFMVSVGLLAYGYYLHHIVSWQTTEDSAEIIALEVGFPNAAAVPPHVKEALVISDRLAKEGKAPWLPGQWREVQWPEIPHQPAK